MISKFTPEISDDEDKKYFLHYCFLHVTNLFRIILMKSKLFKQILEETPLETKIFVDKYSNLILRIKQILRDKGISQKELAENMDKKPSEISRWLRGNQNITLRSIAKLEAELGETLIEIPLKTLSAKFKEDYEVAFHTFQVEKKANKVEKKKMIDTSKVNWQPIEMAV